jgi:hypothetical protein
LLLTRTTSASTTFRSIVGYGVEDGDRRGTDAAPAPVVKEVKPSWRTIRYNGTFFHENIYRRLASPEVDAAWEALGIDCKKRFPALADFGLTRRDRPQHRRSRE